MIVNKQKLNDDKTEFIVFGTKQQLSKIGESPLILVVCRYNQWIM